MCKVAIMLSVYKNDNINYLKESVDSLLNQTTNQHTVLIGVDGPVGKEMEQLFAEYELNNKIRIIRYQENRGLAAVLNDLLKICKAENFDYYARMDADDVAVNNRFEKQCHYLEQHPEVDVVGGAIEEIDGESNPRGKKVSYPLSHGDCKKMFGYRNPMAHPAVMFRKSYFEKVEGYRSEFRKNQDTMLWFDGFKNGCVFANIPDTVLYFRVTNSMLGKRRNGWEYAKSRFDIRLKVLRELHYGISSYILCFVMFCIQLSPVWLKKILYQFR